MTGPQKHHAFEIYLTCIPDALGWIYNVMSDLRSKEKVTYVFPVDSPAPDFRSESVGQLPPSRIVQARTHPAMTVGLRCVRRVARYFVRLWRASDARDLKLGVVDLVEVLSRVSWSVAASLGTRLAVCRCPNLAHLTRTPPRRIANAD